MDTQTLKVAPKVGQLNIVLGDEIVARVHESDRRDYAEAQNYADEMVRRYNAFHELVNTLNGLLKATRRAKEWAEVQPQYADDDGHFVGEWIDEAHALLQSLKA